MAVINFIRKQQGGHGENRGRSDLRVYVVAEKRGRLSVAFRLSEPCMQILGFKVGGFVTVACDSEKRSVQIRPADRKTGCVLSGQGKGGGVGTVRFSADPTELEQLGVEIGRSLDADLISRDGGCAVFSLKAASE